MVKPMSSHLREPSLTFDDLPFREERNIIGEKGKLGKSPHCAAIILAGGSGERFGKKEDKLLIPIVGKPVLTWSVEAFDAVEDVGLILIVCPDETREEIKKTAIDPYPFVTPIEFSSGGSTRQESAFFGLEYVPESYEFVILHDAARPLLPAEVVEHAINMLKGNIDTDGVVVGYPSVDTLKVVEEGIVEGTPDRNVFWNAQTPQVLRAGIYRRAQAAALSDGFLGTDDASLIERLGGKILMFQGLRDNIKLTYPEDYYTVSAAIMARLESNL